MASRSKRRKPPVKPSQSRRSVRLRVEPLEDRRLLSGATDILVSVAPVSAPPVAPAAAALASVPAVTSGQTTDLVVVTVTPLDSAASTPTPAASAAPQVFLASTSAPPVLVPAATPADSSGAPAPPADTGPAHHAKAKDADHGSAADHGSPNTVEAAVAKKAWSLAVANNTTDTPNEYVIFGRNHQQYIVDVAPIEAILRADSGSDIAAKPTAAPVDATLVLALADHPGADAHTGAALAAKQPEAAAEQAAHSDMLAEFFAQEAKQAAARSATRGAAQGMDLTAIDGADGVAKDGREMPSVVAPPILRFDHALDLKALAPALADLFTDLMPIDLLALESGAQQFMEHLENVSLVFSQPGNLAWWSAGAASLGAAVVAMEISRRHLKVAQPTLALASGGESKNGTWFPPESSGSS
jgi:hypothetical protein